MTRRFEILQHETVFDRLIFRINELELRYEKFDGSMAQPIKRLVLDRGEAATVLLHDPDTDEVLLCEQFRPATIKHGSGWLVELPAGMLDKGETAEDCARRETLEETSQESGDLTRIGTVYLSPGGSSERIHIFYSRLPLRQDLPDTAGITDEGEDIRVVLIPVTEAFARLHAGTIEDAKTVIALQWLELQRGTSDGSKRPST